MICRRGFSSVVKVPSPPGDRAAFKLWVERLIRQWKAGWDQRANASAGPPIEALPMVGRRGLAAAGPYQQTHYTTPYELSL